MAEPPSSSSVEKTEFLKWFQKYLKALPNGNTESRLQPHSDPQRTGAGVPKNQTSVVTGDPSDRSGCRGKKKKPPPIQPSVEAEKTQVVDSGKNEGSLKPQHEQSLQGEQYEVALDGDDIVVRRLSSGIDKRGARKPPEDNSGIPVANFKKWVALMNGSTFHDRTLVNSLLAEISASVPAAAGPLNQEQHAAAATIQSNSGLPLPPTVFNKWYLIPSTVSVTTDKDQTKHGSCDTVEYKCLSSTSGKLDVILTIPSSLNKLLQDAVTCKGLIDLHSSSYIHHLPFMRSQSILTLLLIHRWMTYW